MFNSYESCDFSCPGDSSFYGEDVIPGSTFYECDPKLQQQQQPQQPQQLSNGSVYGRMPINEPAVNFGNGSFYNAPPAPRTQPFVGAMLGRNVSSAGMQRYHPYHLQQPQDAFYHQRGSLLNVATPCRESRPWSYAYCYGYAPTNTQPCQFSQFVDIEDFM
ncbi:uncharacterized protein Dyak_GE27287 [Drosophila yakuba]|nr:uncharacterized protein Dyak_GE27287 [Drosophila yakuba]